ncbi:unnamed protein product [Symbiodinium sp. CCMP2592]|nr:unnamed protein product [Symbiodinium sp. CCMP2592]
MEVTDGDRPPGEAEEDNGDWPDEEEWGDSEQACDDYISDLSYEESPNGTIYFDERNEAKFEDFDENDEEADFEATGREPAGTEKVRGNRSLVTADPWTTGLEGDIGDGDDIKAIAFRACVTGEHVALNPARQRLLVASCTEAKRNKSKGKAKATSKADPKPPKKKNKQSRYGIAKDAFMKLKEKKPDLTWDERKDRWWNSHARENVLATFSSSELSRRFGEIEAEDAIHVAEVFALIRRSRARCVMVSLGAYGGPCIKQVMLVGTAPWLGRLGRPMTPIARERIRRVKSFLKFESHRHYVDFRGKVRSVGRKDLKKTQEYPAAFGIKVGEAIKNYLDALPPNEKALLPDGGASYQDIRDGGDSSDSGLEDILMSQG